MKGRIIKALAGYYYVLDGDQQVWFCRARGVFKKRGVQPMVGDKVRFDPVSDQDGWITSVKPRENSLVRPPIANVDQALLVFAVKEPPFNPALVDRLLAMVEYQGITPLLCLTKIDLLEDQAAFQQVIDLYQEVGYFVCVTSVKTGQGQDELLRQLSGKNTVLAGPSGAGKSSLINALCPDADLETGKVSAKLGRGKHTTRHVELLRLPDSGFVADTPGFSQLDLSTIPLERLDQTFPEMRNVSSNCRFRGCLHRDEPGCAVKSALDQGEIVASRYENYLQFLSEIEMNRERGKRL